MCLEFVPECTVMLKILNKLIWYEFRSNREFYFNVVRSRFISSNRVLFLKTPFCKIGAQIKTRDRGWGGGHTQVSYHPPREKGEGAVFTYLHVCEEKSYDHSSQVHPPLHPGGQGSGVPNQSDPSPVGGQCGPPPLPIRRGARPVLFSFPPRSFLSPSGWEN